MANPIRPRPRALILAALAALVTAATLVAQVAASQVFGVVKDKNGGVIPGATVALVDTHGTTRTMVSKTDGTYAFPGVPAGTYVLTVKLAGFMDFRKESVVVRADTRVQVVATLAVSGASQTAKDPDLHYGELRVVIKTPLGDIAIAVDQERAPVTTKNFLRYVNGHFYDGGNFHRATRPDNYTPALPNRPAMALIQGGINPAKRADVFPPIPLERTSVTGLHHVRGTVSMARGNDADTATSDFFILLDDQPSLDFGGKRFDDGQGAAAFGRVLKGLDVVEKIQQQPVQGQNLTPPIPITSISMMIRL